MKFDALRRLPHEIGLITGWLKNYFKLKAIFPSGQLTRAISETLVASPDRVFSRGQLLDAVYADNLEVSERAVDSHMKNLRRKLAQAAPAVEPIRSIYGVGFVFEP